VLELAVAELVDRRCAMVIAMSVPESLADWLPAWMQRQIALGTAQPAQESSIAHQAVYLTGWMGVDTVLTATGEVYVGEYELEAFDSAARSIRWRQALALERVGFIVLGARRFAELRALLPVRTADATPCVSCRGSGDWHVFSQDRKESLRIRGMICKDCGGLGWRASRP
jgi:hypothetical protein